LSTALTLLPLGVSANQKTEQYKNDIKKTIQIDKNNHHENYDLENTLEFPSIDKNNLNSKMPPKLKKLYRKLLKCNSKKDFANLVLTKEEMFYFINLVPEYSSTRQ
jgi:hypothetical protein